MALSYFIQKTFAENRKAACHFMEMAEKHNEGKRYNIVAVFTFCAFSIEAFLNHVGEKVKGDAWKKWDQKDHPKPMEKINRLILDKTDLTDSDLARFTEIFKLRNMIAHGWSYITSKDVKKPQNNLQGAMNDLKSDFEKKITLKEAKVTLEYTESIIEFINAKTIKEKNLWGIGSGSIQIRKQRNC